MELFPAIDLVGGRAVRLLRGDYAQMTVYHDDPPAVARDFAACGARYAHVVDLEGARDGGTPNLSTVERIVRESGLRVEVGGGVRDEQTVARYLDAGVWRVILGTAAVTDPDLLEKLAARYAERIAVSVGVRNGYVALRGWTQQSGLTCDALCGRLVTTGIRGVICTDIARDGAMRGTNHALYEHLTKTFPALDVVASGGVSSLEEVKQLAKTGVFGAIIGKAYYTGAIDLRRALEVTA